MISIYNKEIRVFFFVKQKTAYEMRISDWSSDVCSSDLARKNYQDDGSINGERALLVTGLPNWLCGTVIAEAPPAKHVFQPERVAAPIDIETVIPDVDDSGRVEHAIGLDYFAFEEKATDELDTGAVDMSQEVVPLSGATPHEKVSLYNDDHLPYSFLWWLNKTRMEHAGTYRPYAPDGEPAVYPPDRLAAPDAEQVLDHQTRAKIFHLQSPEQKLGTAQP